MQKKIISLQYGIALFVFLNLLILDYVLITKIIPKLNEQSNIDSLQLPIEESMLQKQAGQGSCPNSCLLQIYNATASANIAQQTIPVATKVPEQKPTIAAQAVLAKEYFVPFGSGSSTATDWTDVVGLQTYIDTNQYGTIKKAVFEVSLYTPTGNQTAYARLFDKTDNIAIWLSEVNIEGGQPKLLTSQPLTLPSGNKLYQVQMKTQLGAITNLQQARLRITAY